MSVVFQIWKSLKARTSLNVAPILADKALPDDTNQYEKRE